MEGCPDWPERFEVGIIAGSAPYRLSRFFGRFEGAHDGTVSITETRALGLAHHLVVRTSHMGLLLSREVATQAARFLCRGQFAVRGTAGDGQRKVSS